ncbi:MAG: hypothetical protein L0215_17995 [Gemmataceae bacterium]|nr:hypothetical protein [Gemmataceae bacterium]
MNEFLTQAEIYKRFDSEWVLLENPQTDEYSRIQGGAVVCHSKNRDDVYRAAKKMQPSRFAILYTGKIPEGSAVIL